DGLVASIGYTHGATNLASWTYGRTAAGLVASTTSNGVGPATQTYAYDPLNQLKQLDASANTYDSADNLTTLVDSDGATTRQTFDAANQLCSPGPTAGTTCSTTPTGDRSYAYDTQGNRIAERDPAAANSTTYTYDQANRLTSITPPGATVPSSTYTYNA